MGKNKQQIATEARAKKTAASAQEAQPTAEQPKQVAQAAPAPPAAAPAQPSKQVQTIEKLKEGWTANGVALDKLTVKDDGKFKLLIVDKGWPTVQVGASGGITVLELKSYAKAFDAAMNGLALYDKQKARDQKKSATTAAPPTKAPVAEKQTASA